MEQDTLGRVCRELCGTAPEQRYCGLGLRLTNPTVGGGGGGGGAWSACGNG